MPLRRSLMGQAAGLGAIAASVQLPMPKAVAQQAQSAMEQAFRSFEFVGPENDPEFGPAIRGGAPAGVAVGTGEARHEEVATAFRLLFSDELRARARANGHMGAAEWLEALTVTNRENPGERYNAEWQRRSNPLIVAFFGLTNTLPSAGDQTSWCAAFVNFCLYMGGRKGTFSALSGSFRESGNLDPVMGEPQAGDVVVFSKYGEEGRKGFGHVGFFVRREGSSIIVLGGNQGGQRGTTGAVTRVAFREQGNDLQLYGFRRPRMA